MRQLTAEIAAGELNFTLDRELVNIEALLGFASRENQKRGYLFVSKETYSLSTVQHAAYLHLTIFTAKFDRYQFGRGHGRNGGRVGWWGRSLPQTK